MSNEISDAKKRDLEKVLCDDMICLERGDRARCYLHIYKECVKYSEPKGLNTWNPSM